MGIDLAEFVDEFRLEATTHLHTLNTQLLELERNPTEPEPVRLMFLAAHSLKGAGSMMDLAAIQALAHAVEDILARLRDGVQLLDSALADRLFRAFDHLEKLVIQGEPGATPVDATTSALIAELVAPVTAAVAVPPSPVMAVDPVSVASVLLVEDSATVRLLHQHLLEQQGWLVDAAATGPEGLAMLAQVQYQCLVVSMHLADQPGQAWLAAAMQQANDTLPPAIVTQAGQVLQPLDATLPGVPILIGTLETSGLTTLVQQLLTTPAHRH